MKTKCSKLFGPYPFAHRQPSHDGHCKLIHGHDWKFLVVFSATEPDKNGFVIDFGEMAFIKEFLTDRFDHTLVLPSGDPEIKRFRELEASSLAKLTLLAEASAEGLANYLLHTLDDMVKMHSDGRVSVDSVTVFEDEKNSASASKS